MSARLHVHLAAVALSMVIVGIACHLLLAFYVPRLVWVWSQAGEPLTAWQNWLSHTSYAAMDHGRVLIILLAHLFCAALAWRTTASIILRRTERTTP